MKDFIAGEPNSTFDSAQVFSRDGLQVTIEPRFTRYRRLAGAEIGSPLSC